MSVRSFSTFDHHVRISACQSLSVAHALVIANFPQVGDHDGCVFSDQAMRCRPLKPSSFEFWQKLARAHFNPTSVTQAVVQCSIETVETSSSHKLPLGARCQAINVQGVVSDVGFTAGSSEVFRSLLIAALQRLESNSTSSYAAVLVKLKTDGTLVLQGGDGMYFNEAWNAQPLFQRERKKDRERERNPEREGERDRESELRTLCLARSNEKQLRAN